METVYSLIILTRCCLEINQENEKATQEDRIYFMAVVTEKRKLSLTFRNAKVNGEIIIQV